MAAGRGAARFLLSAPRADGLPPFSAPEVAVVGRSNVGKSSLLGRLLGAPSLVRTSRTPGRTQLLNAFALGEAWVFVDCPGYGYAKLSLTQRAQLQRMIEDYLLGERAVAGVLVLLDARRGETSEADRQMVARLLQAGRQVLVVLTKIDLIAKPQRLAQIARVARSLGLPPSWVVATSSKAGDGLKELWARLVELLDADEPLGDG